jgi:hypothetical protein
VSLAIRRITIAVLAAFLAGAVLAVPASSKSGPAAVAKKKAKKCKKGKKGKKRKGCKRSGSSSGTGLPGQATPSKPTQPTPPPNSPTLSVASLSVTPGTVLGGNSSTAQVTIDSVAPSGGQQVNLQSSDSSRVSVPASVVVAPDQTSASFPVNTTVGAPLTATLTGSIGASSASTQLNIVDTESVSSVQLERKCFVPGTLSENRVWLDVPASEDLVVNLSSSDPSVVVDPTVTVQAGSMSAPFSVTTTLASGSVPVTVTATLGSSTANGTATVYATDPVTHVDDLTLDPTTLRAGDGSKGTVTLDCEAPPGGTTVTLSSANPGVTFDLTGTQTATVTVLPGDLSADFDISTDASLPDGEYDVSATVGTDTPVHKTLTINSHLPT